MRTPSALFLCALILFFASPARSRTRHVDRHDVTMVMAVVRSEYRGIFKQAASVLAAKRKVAPTAREQAFKPGEQADAFTPSETALLLKQIPNVRKIIAHNLNLPAFPTSRGATDIALYQKAAPAVVMVLNCDRRGKPVALGSGSVLDPQGHVLTNWHVVNGAAGVLVIFKPKPGAPITRELVYRADVVKIDEKPDLALLSIEDPPASMQTLTLGSGSEVEVGSDVFAIGHPDGLTWTYTKGIVSQVRDDFSWTYGEDGSHHEATVIQTQTPINPGNSGGPLLDENGRIIGVNTWTEKGVGLNFAVGLEAIRSFLKNPAGTGQGISPGHERPSGDASRSGKHYVYYSTRAGEAFDLVGVAYGNTPPKLFYFEARPDGSYAYAGHIGKNGKLDVIALDLDSDGKLDTYLVDDRGDGRIHWVGIDLEETGKITRYAFVR